MASSPDVRSKAALGNGGWKMPPPIVPDEGIRKLAASLLQHKRQGEIETEFGGHAASPAKESRFSRFTRIKSATTRGGSVSPPRQTLVDRIQELEENDMVARLMVLDYQAEVDLYKSMSKDLRSTLLQERESRKQTDKGLAEKVILAAGAMHEGRSAYQATYQALQAEHEAALKELGREKRRAKLEKEDLAARLYMCQAENDGLAQGIGELAHESYIFRCATAVTFELFPSVSDQISYNDLIKRVVLFCDEKRAREEEQARRREEFLATPPPSGEEDEDDDNDNDRYSEYSSRASSVMDYSDAEPSSPSFRRIYDDDDDDDDDTPESDSCEDTDSEDSLGV